MGADPIVTAVSVVSGELNGFLVRKTEKQHGTGQRRRCLYYRLIHYSGNRSRPRIWIRDRRGDVPGGA